MNYEAEFIGRQEMVNHKYCSTYFLWKKYLKLQTMGTDVNIDVEFFKTYFASAEYSCFFHTLLIEVFG